LRNQGFIGDEVRQGEKYWVRLVYAINQCFSNESQFAH